MGANGDAGNLKVESAPRFRGASQAVSLVDFDDQAAGFRSAEFHPLHPSSIPAVPTSLGHVVPQRKESNR